MKSLFFLGLHRSIRFVIWTGLAFLTGCSIAPVGLDRPVVTDQAVRLTSDPAEEYAPAWSPDGRYIAFTIKDQRGNFDVALIESNGDNPIRLTQNPTYDGLPAWSPDGQWIAFESDRDFHADIWVMDFQGKNLRKLTRVTEGHFTPSWSPDGRWILHESIPLNSSLSGNRELWIMDPNGHSARKLADGFNPEDRELFFTTGHFHGTGLDPTIPKSPQTLLVSKPYDIFTCGLSWSPDGQKIAFESVRGGAVGIWVMNSDGSHPVQLTRDLSNNWHPVWSPDGKRIAFASDRSGNYDIWVMDADGGRLTPVTQDPFSDFRPSWSPDGKKIVFTSLRSGNADLWIAKVH